MERVDCVVVGAGVIGLAAARRLALAGREVIVLEAAEAIGTETSSRNSEVIHAGIYYPQGSLKAASCVEGRELLYRYCVERGIPHARIGKLIVATSEGQHPVLEQLLQRARAAGVHDLRWVERDEARELEPAVRCTRALLSPSTGIIDSHALMLAYQGEAEDHGAFVAFHSPLERAVVQDDGIRIEVGGQAPMQLLARVLVNSAGLHAPDLARRIEGLDPSRVPTPYLCKGHYFTLAGRSPFRHLIYPVPDTAGLGVHVTLDLAGAARFGPDVEWIEAIDYDVPAGRALLFYDAIRDYWPELPDGALQPGYTGIRPKIVPAGAPPGDFVVQGPAEHGVQGLVNLYGIESPGLTSSLPLADRVSAALGID
jgi:L-2-hydroxyglutarate oxidase LhgO